MNRVCITGGAGFIGSNLADSLLSRDVEVVVIDNFCTGRRAFLNGALADRRFRLVESDVADSDQLDRALSGCDWVFHLQANADVRHGVEHPTIDLEQNTINTSRVLESMRRTGVRRIVFSSTGSVYGEPTVFPTPEDAPFPVQTSLYAASKLAGESLVQAYSAGFGFLGIICRFVSILGERYTHGHVFDFYHSLRRDPEMLTVLGDGKQEKSYLYVGDCIEAMKLLADHYQNVSGTYVFNLGTEETVLVDESIGIITDHLGVSPRIEHTGGVRGWIGDSPLIRLDTTRLRSLGWNPELDIRTAIVRTLLWLEANDASGPDAS